MAKIWFRAGYEANVTDEEMEALLIYSGQKEGETESEKAYGIMESIIDRAILSGETNSTHKKGEKYGTEITDICQI